MPEMAISNLLTKTTRIGTANTSYREDGGVQARNHREWAYAIQNTGESHRQTTYLLLMKRVENGERWTSTGISRRDASRYGGSSGLEIYGTGTW